MMVYRHCRCRDPVRPWIDPREAADIGVRDPERAVAEGERLGAALRDQDVAARAGCGGRVDGRSSGSRCPARPRPSRRRPRPRASPTQGASAHGSKNRSATTGGRDGSIRTSVGEVQSVTQTEPSPTASPQGTAMLVLRVASTVPLAGSMCVSSPVVERLQSAPAPKLEATTPRASACPIGLPLRRRQARPSRLRERPRASSPCRRWPREQPGGSAARRPRARLPASSSFPARSRQRPGCRIECRILAQDRLLQLPQRLAGLDPELADQPPRSRHRREAPRPGGPTGRARASAGARAARGADAST